MASAHNPKGWQTYSQPLRVVILVIGEESIQRIVARQDKASKVCEELATEVEDDEEKVQGGQADDCVRLGNTSALLKVVQGGVLGQLEVPG